MNPRFLLEQPGTVVAFIKVEIVEISWNTLTHTLQSFNKTEGGNSLVAEITFLS